MRIDRPLRMSMKVKKRLKKCAQRIQAGKPWGPVAAPGMDAGLGAMNGRP